MADEHQLIAGRYEVQGLLDAGGMGEIYHAFDRNLGCQVVLKMPRPSALAEPGFAERFSREIRSLVVLAHPYIVRILDVGSHDGRPFAVMPFLGGGNLRTRGIPAPPVALNDWLLPIAEALDFVHQRGFLHRDVKPPNILFDEHGHPYLSDFGVAKVLSAGPNQQSATNLTGTGNVIGTASYLAPELIMGKQKVDGRADQYALAATVYELLSGRVPFDGPTPAAIMVKQTVAKLPPLRAHAPALGEALAAAVEKGLNKDPKKRYPDCASFARAVLLAAAEGPAPRPAPPTGRTASLPVKTQAVAAPAPRILPSPPSDGGEGKVRGRSRPRPTEVEQAPETPAPLPAVPPPVPAAAVSGKSKQSPAVRPEPPLITEEPPPPNRKRFRRRLILAAVFAALLVGVGAGGVAAFWLSGRDAPADLPEGPAKAACTIEPIGEVRLRVGEAKRVPVRIRRGGFDGPVQLTCKGLPAGVTVEPAAIDAEKLEGAFIVKAAAGAAVGKGEVRVGAVAGPDRLEATFLLQVLPAPHLALQGSRQEQVLYPGDEPTLLRFTVTRQECGDQPVLLRIDRSRLPQGVTAGLVNKELPATAASFEVVLRAQAEASVKSVFRLIVRAELPGGQVHANAAVNGQVLPPPVRFGRARLTRSGDLLHLHVPVLRNGYRGDLKASVKSSSGMQLADRPKVSEDAIDFSLRKEVGVPRHTARPQLLVQAGGVALPVVSIPVPIESPIVASLAGPARPRLQFTPDGRALLSAGTRRDHSRSEEQFVVWKSPGWAQLYASAAGKVLLDPGGRWALLRQPRKWQVWSAGAAAPRTLPLDAADSQHILSGDGGRLAFLATETRTITIRDDKVRVEGAGRPRKEEKTTQTIRILDTSSWGLPVSYPDPTPGGRLAAVSGDGRWIVEGRARDWHVLQVFPPPAQERYALKGEEYEDVVASPDDRYLACRSDHGQVIVLEARTGRAVLRTPALGLRLTARFVPGRRLLATTDRDGVTTLWDLEKGAKTHALDGTASGPLTFTSGSLAFDRQQMWSVDSGKLVLLLKGGSFLGVSRDESRALVGEGGSISLVDLRTRVRLLRETTHASEVLAADLSPDGKHLAAADEAGLVQVVEVSPGKAR